MKPPMARRYLAEFVGTFVIVFAPVALSAGAHRAGGEGGLLAAAWVSGLSVLVMVYALGPISAAHFNPAVTLGFVVARRFPLRHLPGYWAAQFAGGVGAALTAALLLGGGSGAHTPSGPALVALGLEMLLTAFLMLVIMAVATDKRVPGGVAGVAIGLTVVVDVLIGGPVSGGSMNPARSFGPALFAGGASLASFWVYAVGPCLGAMGAALLYEVLRGGHEYACNAE